MRTIWQDIQYGFRMLRKNPGFSTVVILILAVGIGANTAIFTMTCSVLLSPLPFDDPERLVFVQNESKKSGNRFSCSGPEYIDWVEQGTVFEEISAFTGGRLSMTGAGDPLALSTLKVTLGFFRTLGVRPMLGRGFLEEDGETSKHRVAVLSHRLWKDAFGGDPHILGKEIVLDGTPTTVVGVTGPTMGFIEDLAQLYMPLTREQFQGSRTNRYLAVFGRLKSGVSPEQAQAQMNLVAERLAQQYPQSNKNIRIIVASLQNLLVKHILTAFIVLHGAVACLLLIACANVSNLLLARSNARAHEIAVRSALGAHRVRIFQQIITESLLLGLLGGGLGVVFACWGLDGLKFFAPKMPQTGGNLPGFDEIRLNTAVLGFTVVLSILTAMVFGLLPAWRTSSCRFREILSQCGYFRSEGQTRRRTLGALVISQIAMALILLTSSGLLIRSFAQLQAVDLGFVPRGLLALEMERPDIPANRASSRRSEFYKQVVKRLAELPGVESACAISLHPLSPSNYRTSFEITDATSVGKQSINGEYRMVTSDYFKCMKIPLLKGRYFLLPNQTTGENVTIVNQEFVSESLLEDDPIGKSIIIHGVSRKIIGVVGDVKVFSPLVQDAEPIVYEPIHQNCPHGMTVLLRTAQEPKRLVSTARRAIWEIDADQPILRIQTMNQIVAGTTSVERFCMILFLVMGCAALLMAITGIYAIVAYAVNERTREIGIRMAIGAERADILKLAMRRAVILMVTGLVLGFIGAFVLTRCMSGLLFHVNPTDWVTFLSVPVVLLITGLLASYIPALRAAKIDPMEALRYE